MSATRYLLAGVLALLSAGRGAAQHDIVARGLRHGATPPAWMLRRAQEDPGAFEIRRGWKPALEAARERRARLRERGVLLLDPADAAGQAAAVTGTFAMPVIPLLYQDTPGPPVTLEALTDRLFSAAPELLSVTGYFREVSRGLAEVTGSVAPWARVRNADAHYEGDSNGAPPFLGELLAEALASADAALDFRDFDRDGDGLVDFVIFVHPEPGGECGNRNIWSHRWSYDHASGTGAPFRTADGVGVSDYLIVPALTCPEQDGTTRLNDIGVIAHEIGHAFGLPDLYATNPLRMMNAGIAQWGLMGSGNWNTPSSPAHMEAWSKAELGWIPVRTLSAGAAGLALQPAETDGVAFRIDLPPPAGETGPTREYFLLENRQRIGSDRNLAGTGLLIWHVDEATLGRLWPSNTVMEEAGRKGLDLEEADGLRNLDIPAGSAWPSHPFPGAKGVTAFGPGTTPSSAHRTAPTPAASR